MLNLILLADFFLKNYTADQMNKATILDIYLMNLQKMYRALQCLDDLETFVFLFIVPVGFSRLSPNCLFLFVSERKQIHFLYVWIWYKLPGHEYLTKFSDSQNFANFEITHLQLRLQFMRRCGWNSLCINFRLGECQWVNILRRRRQGYIIVLLLLNLFLLK